MPGRRINPGKLLSLFSLRTKLMIVFFVMITITICFMGVSFYGISTNVMSSFAAQNVYELIKKNNEIMDQRLSNVVNSSLSLITDKNLFDVLSGIEPEDSKSRVSADIEISKILTRYFISEPETYSYKLVTSYYTFSPDLGTTQPGFLPYREFGNTYLFKNAMEANGKIAWIPTYDFVRVYSQKELENSVMEGRYVFSAVRLIDSLTFENGQTKHLNKEVERPVLVIDFLPDFYNKRFEDNDILRKSCYAVISRDGTVVTQSGTNGFNVDFLAGWVRGMGEKTSGYEYINVDGNPWILSYDTSGITNWITLVAINSRDLTRTLLDDIKSRSIYLAVILCIVSVIVACIISVRVTNPINRLVKAAEKIGEGDFDIVISEEGDVDFKHLIHTINKMSREIKNLIKENYEVALREKEATIGALTMQLNPHFLYNTINIINWMAIRNKQKDISTMLMSLSHMLNYTVRSKGDIVCFQEDLEWLKKYLYIMSIRFENKFAVTYEVESGTLEARVPKLFLQPIIENIFTHAFDDLLQDGRIRISARKDADVLVFTVEDNGKGMEEEDLRKILNRTADNSLRIGLSNVDERIKLLYGGHYGVKIASAPSKGTAVTITVPVEVEQTTDEMTQSRKNDVE